MKVSVITVCFNAAETIGDTIKSVLAQDFTDFEYLIIDGASSDETLQQVEQFADQRIRWHSAPDKGVYFGMNKGIALAQGEIVSILNADDTFANASVLSKVVSHLEVTGAETCYGDLQYVNRSDTEHVVRTWISGAFKRTQFKFGWMPPHPAFFAKLDCYARFGSFDTDFRTSADYELMLRMLFKQGISTIYIPEVLVKMKAGGQSNITLKNRLKANLEDRLAWQKNSLGRGWIPTLLKPLRKVGQFFGN